MMQFPNVKRILVDRRNYLKLAPVIVAKIRGDNVRYLGLDIETEDSKKHPGLIAQAKGKSIIFDIRRTVITGCSFYVDNDDEAYYLNTGHADIENRLTWEELKAILDSIPSHVQTIAHNAGYERTMFKMCGDYNLRNLLCSMYLCVTAYNPDTYNIAALPSALSRMFTSSDGGKMLMEGIVRQFSNFRPGDPLTPEQAEIFYKFAAKESDAAHSYNGVVKNISWGYSLKKAVKSWFNYDMMTFEECLRGREHMGQLTGEEVVDYGCDDAIWCLRLFHRVIAYLLDNNPDAIEAYFRQENPMVEIYSDSWCEGVRIDSEAVTKQFAVERAKAAEALRTLRDAICKLLPDNPGQWLQSPTNEWLLKTDKWYQNDGHKTYRDKILRWVCQEHGSDEQELARVGGALFEDEEDGDAIKSVKKKAPKGNVNLSHYMPVRTILYDLFEEKPIYLKGKIASDADAKGRLMERIIARIQRLKDEGVNDTSREEAKLEVMSAMFDIARIEQVMKLYLKPYRNLIDPETGRVYPTIQALLATRRTSMSYPNGQQLAKQGVSVYVRGFYLADDDDSVIASADWSSIELVLPGEFSQDPAFLDAFKQIPYKDLHSVASIGALEAWRGVSLTLEQFKEMKSSKEDVDHWYGLPLLTNQGEKMSPAKYHKWVRTKIGKVSNFNYWYSGALSSVGDTLGWTSDIMWAATEKYRQTFPVAEAWRKGVIERGSRQGFIQLPDGTIRYRLEATLQWQEIVMGFFNSFNNEAFTNFGKEFVKKQMTRAKNQLVNALIQGTCATMMKRSAIRLRKALKDGGFKARFMMPIHDEILCSVPREEIIRFLPVFRSAMVDGHQDIVKTLALNANISIGRNFEPFPGNQRGQIELDEAPEVDWLPEEVWGEKLGDEHIQKCIDHLFSQEKVAA